MDAYIFDSVRTPRGRGKSDGALHSIRPIELGKTVLQAIVQRQNLNGREIEDVILGCVNQIGEQGGNVAKACVMYAGLPDSVPAFSLNRFCGSGLEALNTATSYVQSGMRNLVMAGGLESMSRIAMGSDGGAWNSDPELIAKTGFIPQGVAGDLIASVYGYTRQIVDQFAFDSQMKAKKAVEGNYFKKSIIAVKNIFNETVLEKDEHPRSDITLEKLAKLKASFVALGEEMGFAQVALKKYPQLERLNYVHHAGNSSGIVDGAAAILVGNKQAAKLYNLKPRARVVASAIVSTEPTIMLTGPAPAMKKVLEIAKMNIKEIDLFEINEAFASVVLRAVEELEIPIEKVNVNGGSIAFGHPLGATGAILVGTAIDELERTGKRFAMISLCIGGGMGIATIIERVENV